MVVNDKKAHRIMLGNLAFVMLIVLVAGALEFKPNYVTIDVTIYLNSGNQISLYGTLLGPEHSTPETAVDYSNQVVGGKLSARFRVPSHTGFDVGYKLGIPLNNYQDRVDGILINGVDSNSYAIKGIIPGKDFSHLPLREDHITLTSTNGVKTKSDPELLSKEHLVKCFQVVRSWYGKVLITGSQDCSLTGNDLRQVVIRVTGRSENKLFDDTILPYNGTQPNEAIVMMSSLSSEPSLIRMPWNPVDQAYEYTFYNVGKHQSFWVHLNRPSREKKAPPGSTEPEFGGSYVDFRPIGGGPIICSSELVHWADLDPGAGHWYAAIVNGSACPVAQGPDTRNLINWPSALVPFHQIFWGVPVGGTVHTPPAD